MALLEWTRKIGPNNQHEHFINSKYRHLLTIILEPYIDKTICRALYQKSSFKKIADCGMRAP